MNLWRDLFFVVFLSCLIWYWPDFGQSLIQAGFCLLYFFVVVSAVFNRSDRISSENNTAQESQASEAGHVAGTDEPDAAVQTTLTRSQYHNVQRSLQQMFKCAYTHLVLPWYMAPEPGDSQPLYTALLREFNFIIDQIIRKAENFDLSITSVACIQIFTHHLHCAKQSDRSPLFSSKAEEMATLRAFSDALIRNLFPEYLWKPNVYLVAFQEILATEVLALVTFLSDPDNVNRLVVSQLDRVPSESLAEEVQDSEEETSSLCWGEKTELQKEEGEEDPFEENTAKKKGSKLKMLSKFWKRGKRKKIKKEEKELMLRALSLRRPAVIQTDSANSGEDSSYESDDITLGDSDVESYTSSFHEEMMEFKLSFEMWRVGKWTVTVTNVEMEDDELCFTVHLEENNNTENLHWDVKKTQLDIVHFYNCCKDISHLPSISMIVENTKTELSDDDLETAKTAFEHFLQALVSDTELGHTLMVFKFLCPLNKLLRAEGHNGGVWVLLGGLASFLTPGQEDDEFNSFKMEEKPDEAVEVCSLPESTSQHDEISLVQPDCTDVSQRQCSDMEGELLVTDSGSSVSSDQTTTDYTDDGHPVNLNLVQFAARTKVIPKKQPACFNSFDSDGDSISQYTSDGPSDHHFNESVKKENPTRKKSSASEKPKGKEKGYQAKEETHSQQHVPKKMTNSPSWGQLEVTKAIFDLLKEISGNSRMFKIIKTALTPFMSLVKKKVNSFLKKLNPSEAQMADYIDSLRELIWPEEALPQGPPRTREERNETKEKAMQLVCSKLAGYMIVGKADVETMFKILQDTEENKKLFYMLLLYLLKEFLPGETFNNVKFKLNGKNTI